MGHWYTQTGEKRYETRGTNGALRPTTLRDARKEYLLPSVTEVMAVVAKPQLDLWRAKQITKATYTFHTELMGLPYDRYHGAIMEKAAQETAQAADTGTAIHKAIEDYYQTGDFDPEYSGHVAAVEEWQAKHHLEFLEHEIVVVNKKDGYAGTVDAVFRDDGKEGVCDFKSRKTKEGQEVKPYESHVAQCAAYWLAKNKDDDFTGAIACNVYLSTTELGRMEVCWYDEDQLWNAYYNYFAPCLMLWRFNHNYDPRNAATENTSR